MMCSHRTIVLRLHCALTNDVVRQNKGTPPIAARGVWGSAQAPPARQGRARPQNAFWRILGLNLRLFEYLMQLCLFKKITDTLSHNIISHKRDEPITRVVSKYRIQVESNGLLYQQNTGRLAQWGRTNFEQVVFKLPQRGPGRSLGRPSGFMHFIDTRWLFLSSALTFRWACFFTLPKILYSTLGGWTRNPPSLNTALSSRPDSESNHIQ